METELAIWRYLYDPEYGTFGFCWIDGMKVWTVERPWQDNKQSVSCIPVGAYPCEPRRFHRGGYDAIHVTQVPARSYILIHKANLADQLAGCIAPGMYRGCYRGKWAVMNSAAAFSLLMEHYGGRRFTLHIKDQENPE